MNAAAKQGWPEVILGEGIAFNEARNSWICRSPVLIRNGSFAWYLFHLEGETYCFRVMSPSMPAVEFVHFEPAHDIRPVVQLAIADAFSAYGFFGLPDHEMIKFDPVFLGNGG